MYGNEYWKISSQNSGCNENIVLQKDGDNAMDRARKQRRSLQEKGNMTHTQNEKGTAEIGWIYNEEGGPVEFDTHKEISTPVSIGVLIGLIRSKMSYDLLLTEVRKDLLILTPPK